MKKLLVALGLIPFWVLAETSIQGGYQWTYSITDEGAVIQAGIYPIPTENLTIPESLEGVPVIGIGVDAFKSMTALKSVTFPSKLKFVDEGAFEGCPLTSLSLPNTVVRIGKAAFSELLCDDFTIPDSVQKIDAHSFLLRVDDSASYARARNIGKWNLGHYWRYWHRTGMGGHGEGDPPDPLVIGNGLIGIADNAYKAVTSGGYLDEYSWVRHVQFPVAFQIIGENAFAGQDKMCDIEIPSSTLEVRVGAFDGVPGPFIFTGAKSDFKFVASSNSFYGAKDTTAKTAYYYEGCPGWKDGEEFHGLITHPYPDKMAIPMTFIGNGEDEVKYLVEGDAYAKYLPEIKLKLGAVFVHWNSSADDSGITITPESLVADVGIETLYAIWREEDPGSVVNCKIVFDVRGGMPTQECRIVRKDTKCGKLPEVTRGGYEFLGWFTAAVGGTQVTAETVVTKDVTFYAHWKRVSSGADEEIVAGEKVTIETEFIGYKASGLPSGLKYDAKSGKITGTAKGATALEGVVVKFTKKNAADEEITIAVRAEDVSVGCEGLSNGPLPAGVVGASEGINLQIYSEGGTKSVSVSKLPAGMKYDSKKGVITGAPSKAGNYEVSLTLTTKFGTKETVKIPVSVAAMPVMAVGKFDGFVSVGEDNLGTFTLTTTDAGKLTAKAITAAGTVSFSGTCWDSVEDGVYRVTLTTKKGEKLMLTLDSAAAWDANQLSGEFTTAAIAETKKSAAVPPRTYSVSAQRNAFGKTWYFAATGDEMTGWKLAYTEDTKGAALTVTLKADGSISIAGKLPNGTDTKGKAVTIKVSASGYANVGGLKDGAILADFAPVLTVNKVKTALAIKINLWFDRKNDHESGVGEARFVQ